MPALNAQRSLALRAAVARSSVRCSASKLLWCPGGTGKLNPAYLDGSLPGCVA
jgi:hypothetical protein